MLFVLRLEKSQHIEKSSKTAEVYISFSEPSPQFFQICFKRPDSLTVFALDKTKPPHQAESVIAPFDLGYYILRLTQPAAHDEARYKVI